MPSCAIITCRARSQDVNVTNGRISFHRFPKEPTIKEQWIEVTGRKDWMPTKTSTICSKHFKEKDYDIKKSGHKYLKCGAVPQEKVVRIYFTGIESPIAAKAKKHKFQSTSDESELIKRRKVESTSLTSDINSTTSTPRSHSNYSEQEMKYAEENLPCSNTSTPRKRKLKEIIITKYNVIKRQRKQIKKIQAQNRRLKKKVNKIEDIMNDLQKRFFLRNEELDTLKNTNIQILDLIARYISKSKSGTDNKQKYSPAIRSFALTLHYYSPKAYEYVRNTFDTCLPHTRTLRKWYSSVEGEPGFTSESFAALKLKVETTKYPIIAGLVMDEMAIRRRIEWDGSKLHGFVEIGNKQCSDHITEAKEALVFLVTGINCNFKVPVAYFLVDGVTGDQRSDLVKQCLERIHDTGVKIVSLTFDGCASNLAMIKKFGCSFDNGGNMTFEHPVTKHLVMAVLDPSHMIKLIRNAFQVYQTFLDVKGKKIQWAYLEELNKVQEKEKFHLRNKLRHRHIHFQNQKMKVKLATQLFSLNVADAIDFCEKKLNMSEFQDSSATTFFLIVINNMFDIFNSRSLNQYGYKKAINEWNAPTIFAYLDEAVQYISTLKTQDGTPLINSLRKVGFLGFLGCAQASKHFYTTLIQTKELLFFPFYKVSQDHLELLFCNIRCHGGANNNPTARQFKAAYKKLLVHVEIKDFGNGNCTALENLSILHCSSAIKRINLTTPSNREFEEDQEDDGSEEKKFAEFYQNMSDFSIQVLSHIAGNVVHVLMEKIQCDICVGALVSNLRNSHHKFIVSKDRGGLLYPSDDVITICKKAESVIRHYTDNSKKFTKEFLVTKILHSFVGTTLFDDIAFHQIGEYPTSNHVTDLMKAVIKKYINIRVHFLLKEYVSKETKRQLLTKYVLFQGK